MTKFMVQESPLEVEAKNPLLTILLCNSTQWDVCYVGLYYAKVFTANYMRDKQLNQDLVHFLSLRYNLGFLGQTSTKTSHFSYC